MDNRKHPRFAVRFRSSFSSRYMTAGEGTVVDFSLGGCRITWDGSVTPGSMLEMRFQLPEQSSPVDIGLATVRWARGTEFGVEFLQVRKEVEQRLRQYVSTLKAEQEGEGSGPVQ